MKNPHKLRNQVQALAANQVTALAAWVGPVPGATRGRLIWEEVKRSFIAAVTGGLLASLAQVFVQAVISNAPVLFPRDSGLIVAVLTLIMELVRRYNQSGKPDPTPPTPPPLPDPVCPPSPPPCPCPAPSPLPPCPTPTPDTGATLKEKGVN